MRKATKKEQEELEGLTLIVGTTNPKVSGKPPQASPSAATKEYRKEGEIDMCVNECPIGGHPKIVERKSLLLASITVGQAC